jgi:hypothetical protein
MLEGGLSAGTLKGIYFDNNKFELLLKVMSKKFISYEIRHQFRGTSNNYIYDCVLK